MPPSASSTPTSRAACASPATSTRSCAEIEDADFLILHKERLPAAAIRNARNLTPDPASGAGCARHSRWRRRGKRHPGRGHAAGQLHHRRRAGLGLHPQLGQAPARPARAHGDRAYVDSWHGFPGTQYLGDLTLGLLGMGEIARPIARVAQAFGMPVQLLGHRALPRAGGSATA